MCIEREARKEGWRERGRDRERWGGRGGRERGGGKRERLGGRERMNESEF